MAGFYKTSTMIANLFGIVTLFGNDFIKASQNGHKIHSFFTKKTSFENNLFV